MAGLTYDQWQAQVLKFLEVEPLFHEAMAVGPYKTLLEMRGDEPIDAFEMGETAEEYVAFLINEWIIFGPEGE